MATEVIYPVRVEAKLDSVLSRWLWLVKWFLVIPHYVVLAFLWLAFMTLSVVAFFAILFTGKYPHSIFEFNVGVMRWSWRVAYYAYGALGTDRYPPFSLKEVPDYPVHLEVAYPEHLSRGLVLIKWWLLAIPHYFVVAILMGGTWFAFQGENWKVSGFGLIALLTFVAAVMLAFTGKYPTGLFDLILGLNRWVIRVAAYAGLMTDVYPPFRLDMGGSEPGTTTIGPPPAPPTAEVSETETGTGSGTHGWTAGPIVMLIAGSLVALMSLGLLAGGGVTLWTHSTQRDSAGFLTTPMVALDSPGFAIVADRFQVETDADVDWIYPRAILGDARVRIDAVKGTSVFVGLAQASDVERYLEGVSYATMPDSSIVDTQTLSASPGGAPINPPAEESFWIESSSGNGRQTITWPISDGEWSIVVMNADVKRGRCSRRRGGPRFLPSVQSP